MIVYNKLSQAKGYKVIEDDNLYLIENLDPKEKVDAHKKVRDGVKIEKDGSLRLDDSCIYLGAD